MPKDQKRDNFDALTAAEVADLLFVSEKTVRNWMNNNDLPSVDSGRGRILKWKSVLAWYVAYRAKEDGNGGNAPAKMASAGKLAKQPESANAALLRKLIAEADLKELDRAERLAEVVAIKDVERNIAAVARNIQQKLLNVPNKLTTRLVGIDDRNRIRAILDAEMVLICRELVTVGAETAKRTPREPREDSE